MGPLDGIRIIDLTRILAGPFCTMNLGDMGAEVIKVEQPGRGDDTRSWGPPFANDQAAYFLGINRNKQSITLNLKSPEGRGILGELLGQADVIIENFKPGTLAKWGFSEDWFEANAPKVVHCSITGYGDKGPKGGMPGYDFLLQAESGLMSITGEEGGGPQKLGVAIVDVCTGQYATMCILAALQSRSTTGEGQRIDVSLFNTSLSMLVNVASNYLIGDVIPSRYGNGHPNIVPYRDYPCGEGGIALAVGNDMQFANLSRVLGHPEWAEDQNFQTNSSRVNNRDACDGMIRDVLAAKPAGYWIDLFEKEGIPCSRVNRVDEALESEQAKANDMVLEMDHPTSGNIRVPGIPYQFSKTPAGVQSPPPLLGADTQEVLKRLLGKSDEDIEKLRASDVV